MSKLADQLSKYEGNHEITTVQPASLLVPEAVIFKGDWHRDHCGHSRSSRGWARTLACHFPTRLETMSLAHMTDGEINPHVLRHVGHLREVTATRYRRVFKHLRWSTVEGLRDQLMPKDVQMAEPRVQEDYLALTTAVVTDRLPAAMTQEELDVLALCPEVVDQVPIWRDESPGGRVGSPYDPGDMPDGVRVYTICKWQPQDAPHELLGYFLHAFTPGDKAALTIKTIPWAPTEGYPSPQESVAYWLKDETVKKNGWTPARIQRRVRVIDHVYDEFKFNEEGRPMVPEPPHFGEMAALHRDNNVYVSLSRTRPVSWGALDAGLAGNAVWAYPENVDMVPVREPFQQYLRIPKWRALPDPSVIGEFLRTPPGEERAARAISYHASGHILPQCSQALRELAQSEEAELYA